MACYWQASQPGSSMAQNLMSLPAASDAALAASTLDDCADTAFIAPECTVDFSACVAPTVRSVPRASAGLRRLAASPVPAAPHLTCIAATRDSTRELLLHYRAQGIGRVVALRGDMPSGMRDPGEFRHANELVQFIRTEFGDHFHIEVAAYPEYHPQAPSPEKDLDNFQRKVDAGANSAITQYFYNADAYFRFRDTCAQRGIAIPIVPGIMPITNFTQLARFSDACGAEIPRWVRKNLESFGDDREAIRAFGLDVVSALCERLLGGGAPGLHFYSMNQATLTLAIAERLGLIPAR